MCFRRKLWSLCGCQGRKSCVGKRKRQVTTEPEASGALNGMRTNVLLSGLLLPDEPVLTSETWCCSESPLTIRFQQEIANQASFPLFVASKFPATPCSSDPPPGEHRVGVCNRWNGVTAAASVRSRDCSRRIYGFLPGFPLTDRMQSPLQSGLRASFDWNKC